MIKVESIHIEEFRGIRKIDLDLQMNSFAISGPNGSGKSGVIDAIEFGLTGQIGRLAGRGTKGLSVMDHGPHVDKLQTPRSAFVELRVFIPSLNKTATITRRVCTPKKPKIVPSDIDVIAALSEIAAHPEITLSRRELLRFILVEPSKRSEEIQALLKLDEIGNTRTVLNAARNKIQNQQRASVAQEESSRNALCLHLGVTELSSGTVLESANQRRKLLGLPQITELTEDARLDAGMSDAASQPAMNKQSAIRDLNALSEAAKNFPDLARTEVDTIVSCLEQLETDPALLAAMQERSFIEDGLEFVDGPTCPLCDTTWEDEQQLRNYLQGKLAKSSEAQALQESLMQNGAVLAQAVIQIAGLLGPAQQIAEELSETAVAQMLSAWKSDLEQLKTSVVAVDGLAKLKARLDADWLATPDNLSCILQSVIDKVEVVSKPLENSVQAG